MSLAILSDGLALRTRGLKTQGHREIIVDVDEPALVPEGEAFLRYVVRYLESSNEQIGPGETMAYGYWLTKFNAEGVDHLRTFEYDATASEFVRGASLALRYWRDQHEICRVHSADYLPPRPDRLAVISDGVLEGESLQGVRYPSPEHMSGWWITTDRYSGNPQDLRTEHLYHLTASRPDVAQYIALPYGYRFDLGAEGYVWFDEEVVTESR